MLLHPVGCLHRCTDDARSHKHQVNVTMTKMKITMTFLNNANI